MPPYSFQDAAPFTMKSSARLAGGIAALFLCGFACGLFPSVGCADSGAANAKVFLRAGWQIQSSCVDHSTGQVISKLGFRRAGWHAATVPSTVVAALVADATYPDPYFGFNLRSIPGTSYPIGKMFSVLPMPKGSPFRCGWWYRTEFSAPETAPDGRVWLHFDGINNRASIWLNGRKIAGAGELVAGAYQTYEFDVTPFVAADRANVLAVEVFAQTENDLGVNWVDWNPTPPDKDMGLWRDVYLRVTGPVKISYPQVVTHFPADPRPGRAHRGSRSRKRLIRAAIGRLDCRTGRANSSPAGKSRAGRRTHHSIRALGVSHSAHSPSGAVVAAADGRARAAFPFVKVFHRRE